jgi:diacylglycerol O-acyltransferase
MHRMSPLDASFLHIEDDRSHMHIGSVAIFEGPPPSYEEIRRLVEGKLPLVPRYRQVVRFVPFGLGRPVWVDDPNFYLPYHLRQTALPAPGGEQQLRNLVGRVMAQPLNRDRPLWEMWAAEGLDEERWALITKVHHCMVDGVSATELLSVILDRERDAPSRAAVEWTPEPPPSGVRLTADAIVQRAVSPYEQLRGARAATRAPRQFAGHALAAARGGLSLRGLLRPTPQSSINGPIGPHRRWSWARARLSDVKRVRTALGGTVNDVVLSVIANGFRELLLSRGEPVEKLEIRSLVPVSVRAPGERGTYNNRVSAMFASLPVGIADPVERLDSVRQQMERLKRSQQAVAGQVLTSMSGFAPTMLLSLGLRVANRMPQRSVNTVTTNVPGPQEPLYAAGRRMLEVFPYVPLSGTVRVGVAIFSYDGALNFGATGDYDTMRDIGVLCEGIEHGLAELLDAAQGDGRPLEEQETRTADPTTTGALEST